MRTAAIILGVLGLVFPFCIVGLRHYCLRPSATARWRQETPVPLGEIEIRRLLRWQRTDLTLFVGTMAFAGVAAILALTRMISQQTGELLYSGFLFLGAISLIHHFSARCPRCRMRIGVQRSLLLPRYCDRCTVAFRFSR